MHGWRQAYAHGTHVQGTPLLILPPLIPICACVCVCEGKMEGGRKDLRERGREKGET
jgi:hypothetical protein